MRKVVVILLLLCALGVPVPAQETDTNLVDAVTLYTNGQNKKARQLLHTLSIADPKNDAVWYYLSMASLRDRDLDSAVEACSMAVALDSANYWYRHLEARLSVLQNKADDGISQYEALVRDFPDENGTWYELLDLYLKNQKFEKALEALDEIEKQRGPSEEVTRTRYDVYTAMGRQDEGAEILEKFNEQFSVPSVLSMLGDYYLADFKDSLALARYEEALSLDSTYLPAVLGKSEVYRHMRRYPDYFKTLNPFFSSQDVSADSKSMYIGNLTRSLDPRILEIHRAGFDTLVVKAGAAHPADSSLLSSIGSYYYTTGREKEAGEWFRKSADLYPESITQTATYIQYLQLQSQWEPLRERSMQGYERFQQLAFLDYANLASYNLEDWDSIIANSQMLLKNFSKDKEICLNAWTQLGDAYHSKGDSKNSYKAYQNALKINPDYAPVLNNYAYYLSLEGKNLKKAYTMSKKTIEQEPDNATYLDTFAWILHLMGRDLEAKPFFKHAMLYGGKESATILRHYATVLEALGEADTAKIYRNQAQRLEASGKQ
ncbi:MAG: tetratricopeptide repeat protein [Bacteroidales bacterium]|nr:tetratricopeptide repeat protein [Bacteroidales bacterium]